MWSVHSRGGYELGKQEDTYHGRFEAQTKLKLNVLTKIVDHLVKQRKRGEVTEKWRRATTSPW